MSTHAAAPATVEIAAATPAKALQEHAPIKEPLTEEKARNELGEADDTKHDGEQAVGPRSTRSATRNSKKASTDDDTDAPAEEKASDEAEVCPLDARCPPRSPNHPTYLRGAVR